MISSYTEQLTQGLSWPASSVLPPANYANNATAYATGPVIASEFTRFIGVVNVGVVTGAGNLSAYLQSSNTASGNYVNISSTNAVAFNNTSNTMMTVECRVDQLPSTGNKYVQLAVLGAANSAFFSAELICAGARYSPASQYNNTTQMPVANQIVY